MQITWEGGLPPERQKQEDLKESLSKAEAELVEAEIASKRFNRRYHLFLIEHKFLFVITIYMALLISGYNVFKMVSGSDPLLINGIGASLGVLYHILVEKIHDIEWTTPKKAYQKVIIAEQALENHTAG